MKLLIALFLSYALCLYLFWLSSMVFFCWVPWDFPQSLGESVGVSSITITTRNFWATLAEVKLLCSFCLGRGWYSIIINTCDNFLFYRRSTINFFFRCGEVEWKTNSNISGASSNPEFFFAQNFSLPKFLCPNMPKLSVKVPFWLVY